MLEKIKQIHYKKLFLYGFYISYIGITSIAAIIDFLIANYLHATIDFLSVVVAAGAFKYYLVKQDEELASILLFWIASSVIFIFVINSQFDISIIFTLLIPMVAFILLSTNKVILHVSLYFLVLGAIFFYGYATYETHPLLYGVKPMSAYIIAMLFVIAFGIFYHIAIEQYYVELERANQQNIILLKEVHHRVKNNLNIISSILGLQKFDTDNKEVHQLINQNRLRLESMAMAHEILYKQDDLEHINFETYITKLASHILALEKGHKEIGLIVQSIHLQLPIESMIQFGIILNELIINSIKYAFKDQGTISISLEALPNDHYLFTYSDNGVGLQGEILQNGFGYSLIEMTIDQLSATLEVVNNPGLTYKITFKGAA
jgi:two-component sensor histidine kinase